jgi:hypothetical protein
MKFFTPYRNEFQEYNDNAIIEPNCAEFTVVNKGTVTAYFNGYPLAANDSIAFSAQAEEIDKGIYNLTYAAGDGTKSIWVIRKLYL